MATDAEPTDEGSEPSPDLDFSFPLDWPEEVTKLYGPLFAFDLDALEGRSRLGDLALREVPPIVERIRGMVRDLTEERWGDLPPEITAEHLMNQLGQVNQALSEAETFTLEQPDPTAAKTQLVARLNELLDWFRSEVVPYTVSAKAKRAAESFVGSEDAFAEVNELRENLATLKSENAALTREVESRADLVSGLRQVAGEEASTELAAVFRARAANLGEAAIRWRNALFVAAVAALLGSVVAFLLLRPDADETFTSADAGRLALLVLIVGLFVYGVRVCGQGYRSSRHLQAVAQSKEAALSTFTRFSSAIAEEEIRNAVALTLAQAVFATEDTGLIDGSSDQVTFVERALPALTPRTPAQ